MFFVILVAIIIFCFSVLVNVFMVRVANHQDDYSINLLSTFGGRTQVRGRAGLLVGRRVNHPKLRCHTPQDRSNNWARWLYDWRSHFTTPRHRRRCRMCLAAPVVIYSYPARATAARHDACPASGGLPGAAWPARWVAPRPSTALAGR